VGAVHEFGLCESILDAVERRAAGRPVTRVSIRCGVFNRVDGPSMRQAFALVADGSVAADAALDLTVVSRPAGVCRMRAGQRGRRDRRPVPGLPRAGRRPERR
jgi:Zn finger protein HypA/HybF involved in hydrogenase expression